MAYIKKAKRSAVNAARSVGHWRNLFLDPSPKLLVVVFHRVVPVIIRDPLNIMLSEEKFIRQLDALVKKYPVISLYDALNQAESGKAKGKCQVALTFDDGYRDNYEVAFPILKKKGIPAAFFVSTDYMDKSVPPWDLSFISALLYNEINSLNVDGVAFRKKGLESRRSFAFRAFERLKSLDPTKRGVIVDMVKNQAGTAIASHILEADNCMTWNDARNMSLAGMDIGSHGMSHTSLSRVTAEVAEREIMTSKSIIEQNIQKSCDHFAFPFGSIRDYTDELVVNVRKAGYKTCLLNVHGYNNFSRDLFSFKRIIMDEYTDIRHILG